MDTYLPPSLRQRLRVAALVLFMAGLCATAQAQSQTQRSGTLKALQGDVTLVRGTTRTPAAAGDGVIQADSIVTGPGSAASMVLRDGTALVIGPNSQVSLARFEYESTTQKGSVLVDVLQGTIRMISGLIAKLDPDQVKVKTPTVVVGVRGTDFIVEVP